MAIFEPREEARAALRANAAWRKPQGGLILWRMRSTIRKIFLRSPVLLRKITPLRSLGIAKRKAQGQYW